MNIPPKVTQRSIAGVSEAEGSPRSVAAGRGGAPGGKDEAVKTAREQKREKAVVKTEVSRGEVGPRIDTELEKVMSTEESLPVLSAFQKFIDKERSRVRHTVLGLSGVFVIALILVLAVAGLVGKAFFGGLKDDMKADRKVIQTTRDEVATMKDSFSVSTKKWQDTLDDMDRERSKARQSMADMASSIDNTRQYMSELGSRINGMETGGDTGIDDLELSFRTLTNQVETLFHENSALRAEIQALNSRYEGASVVAPPASEVPVGIFVEMMPSNTEHRVRWRLPDPS